jgi:hypothetical protein
VQGAKPPAGFKFWFLNLGFGFDLGFGFVLAFDLGFGFVLAFDFEFGFHPSRGKCAEPWP